MERNDVKRTLEWIAAERRNGNPASLMVLVEEGARRFDLSPMEAEQVLRLATAPED